MKIVIGFGLTLFLSIIQLKCDISPIVITPKYFRYNVEENIVIISRKNESIHLTLNNYKTQDLIFNTTFNIFKGEPLQVPLTVNYSSSLETVLLSVISESGEKRESFIKLLSKSGYAFIQTDKPIYTPKENVRLRMLRIDEHLKPLNEQIKLRIKNSQKITVEETSLRPTEPNYFVDYEFEFPPAPRLGLWSAELLYGPNYTSNYSVTFELKEYVLPTFAIKIRSPKFILPSTSNISGSVNVDYVYGKPVNGSAVFKFGHREKSGKLTYFGSTDLKQLANGSAYYFFQTNQFRQIHNAWFPFVNGFRFVVEVTVHERVTGKKDKAIDDSGLFVSSPYVISFKNSFNDFKPNIETYVTAEILNVLGEPEPEIPVSVHLMDERGAPIKPKYISPNMNSSQLVSDHLGRISFPVTLKQSVERLHVTLRTADPNITREEQAESAHILFAYQSNDEFISIENKDKYSLSFNIGDTYRSHLTIRGAIFLDQIYLIIVNRGNVIHSERLINEREIKILITREMLPNIRAFVFAITRSDELVSDSIKINVIQSDCGLDIRTRLDTNQVLPGQPVNLTLIGSIGDSVALLGIDEAVYILRNSDRLTKDKVTKEILKSDLGCGPGGGRNALDVANNAGIKLISTKSEVLDDNVNSCQKTIRVKRDISNIVKLYNGLIRKCCILGTMPSNKRRNCSHKARILKSYMPDHEACYKAFLECCLQSATPVLQASVSKTQVDSGSDRTRIGSGTEEYVHIAYEEELESKTFVRSDFRETWLFDIVIMDKSSKTYEVTPPHSITTWSLIGMSLSPVSGLCIMSAPLRLRTFQDAFIQISLPYSVVQNEQMELIATVFNYGDKRLVILIYFVGVENICSEAPEPGNKAKKNLVIEPNSSGTVAFPMVPLKTGIFDLKVVALWSTGGDTVIRKLNVIPPGITVEEDLTFQLDPKNRQRRSKRSIKTDKIFDIIRPENSSQTTHVFLRIPEERTFVPNTRECIVSGIGDQYGATAYTTLSDIDQLIRQPKGCGEQTMLFMAPTLYTLKYLDSIDKLNGDLKHRGLKYLREGYKRELSFRKDDGSFSAFPTRPSSIWLTAFVMKVLCQASPFLHENNFDPKVIEEGLLWLKNKQEEDGSWSELNPVIHEAALGGVKGSLPLTAYVLIAFHECSTIFSVDVKLDQQTRQSLSNALNKSERFLINKQSEVIKDKNTYAMALMAYSLTFSQLNKSFVLVDALHDYANKDNNKNYKYWKHEYEVEATSYALLSMLKSGVKNSVDALSVANWLNSRRSFSGSFDTTQDTIVALEALSLYARNQRGSLIHTKMNCDISSGDERFKRSLRFHEDNAQVLQKFKVDANFEELRFTTTGDGMGHMLVKVKYNVLEPPEVLCKFDLEIKVIEWKSARDNDEPEEIGENFFSEFDSNLLSELDLRSNRQKRSFWERNTIRRAFNRLRTGTTEPPISVSRDRSISSSGKKPLVSVLRNIQNSTTNDNNYVKNNLSKNSISTGGISKLVLNIEICVRHLPRYFSDMSIVEIGILSGYKPNKDDLEEMIKTKDSLISKFEISERNVVLYFDKIPFGKPYCLQFRTVQNHIVSNSQAAIIRVYDYYHKDHSCSQLYTPTRISEYIETKCNSDVCECAKRENCPNAKSLVEIGTIAEKRMTRARELFEQLICSDKYQYVWTGTFIQQNDTKHGFRIMRFKPKIAFKGQISSVDSFWLTLNKECPQLTETVGRDAIVFGQLHENSRHLNGSTIVYDITNGYKSDEIRAKILDLIVWFDHKIRREDWKCSRAQN